MDAAVTTKEVKMQSGHGRLQRLTSVLVAAAVLIATTPVPLRAQDQAVAATAAAEGYSLEQLDALLAPIALYPDELLTHVLMASAYPLQVVEAARWIEDPANKALTGDQLTQALAAKTWDPSVKALVPFPQVLAMMNAQLDWMQQLGYAMSAQQSAVLASVQRLRQQAQIQGTLQSSDQQIVRTEGQTIVIAPAQPNVVYVPTYNPTVVYGAWPYPAYPPVYLPPPPGYVFGTALATGLAFGAGVAITAGLWGWSSPNWGRGNVNVNVNRYNNINVNRPPINNPAWRPPAGRPLPAGGGGNRPPLGPVGAPGRPTGLPANGIGRPSVSVPGSVARPPAGIGPGQGGANRPPIGQGGANRPGIPAGAANRPATAPRPGGGQGPSAATRPAPATRPAGGASAGRAPGAFQGMSDGRAAGQYQNRGAQSRQSASPRGGGGGAAVRRR
jgi:Protein of unknown function (DUF3300)